VRVESDNTLVSCGESFSTPNRDQTVVRHVEAMGQYLAGRSPFNIKQFCHVIYQDHIGVRGGLEHALWDIVGKAVGQPVYNLLGGACQSKMRVSPTAGLTATRPPGVAAECARQMMARGITALKWDPVP
jgi:galactonate dehydratase